MTSFCNEESQLEEVDWSVVNARYWKDDDDNPDRERRKQAEFLVLKEVDLSKVLGLAVYDVLTQNMVKQKLDRIDLKIPVIVKKEWYY